LRALRLAAIRYGATGYIIGTGAQEDERQSNGSARRRMEVSVAVKSHMKLRVMYVHVMMACTGRSAHAGRNSARMMT
jgi:hypothetical protein